MSGQPLRGCQSVFIHAISSWNTSGDCLICFLLSETEWTGVSSHKDSQWYQSTRQIGQDIMSQLIYPRIWNLYSMFKYYMASISYQLVVEIVKILASSLPLKNVKLAQRLLKHCYFMQTFPFVRYFCATKRGCLAGWSVASILSIPGTLSPAARPQGRAPDNTSMRGSGLQLKRAGVC